MDELCCTYKEPQVQTSTLMDPSARLGPAESPRALAATYRLAKDTGLDMSALLVVGLESRYGEGHHLHDQCSGEKKDIIDTSNPGGFNATASREQAMYPPP